MSECGACGFWVDGDGCDYCTVVGERDEAIDERDDWMVRARKAWSEAEKRGRERDEARESAAQLAEAMREMTPMALHKTKPDRIAAHERWRAALAVFDAKEKTP